MALSHWNGAALADLSAFNTATDISAINGESASLGSDITAPTLSSATVAANGTTLTLVFDEAVTRGAGYADADLNLDASTTGSDIGLTYVSGDGTNTFVYTIASEIQSGETVDLDFNGDADSLEDGSGNDLAAIVSGAVTNNSSQGAAYLINQNFETPTTGYDNSETWTEADGTVDPDNATTPLVGSQSCRLVDNFANITSPDFTGQTDVWAFARIKGESFLHAGGFDINVFSIRDSSNTVLAALVSNGSALYLAANGGNSSASATDDDPASSDWHVWLHFVSGGTCQLFMSTSGTRPSSDGSGAVVLTKTGASGTAVRVNLQNGNTAPVRVDHVLVSASEIGDDP